MNIKHVNKKSDTIKFLEGLRGGPLTFHGLVEAIRLGEEMSQVEFAKKLRIPPSHLCDIEKGRKTVSPEPAARFAKILGYSQKQFIQLSLQDSVNKAGFKVNINVENA